MNDRCNAPRSRQRGLTVLESLASLTVLALTLGSVAPSMSALRDRRHLEGAAAQLATDVRLARSLAVAQAAPVRLSVPAGGACYIVHTGPAADCRCSTTGVAVCTGSAQLLKGVVFEPGGRLGLSSSSASMLFDGNRGTVTPTGTLRLQLRAGASIHQIVNVMGRVRACSPGATVPGYAAC